LTTGFPGENEEGMFQNILYGIVRMMVLSGALRALACPVSQDKPHQQETSARDDKHTT
jgi:hypothetical protein